MDASTLKLASVPKLDKDQFILSFLRSQKPHAKAYAEQGRAAWTDLVASKSTKSSSADKENAYGFSTPVLKPRVPKPSLVPKNDGSSLKPYKRLAQVTSPSWEPRHLPNSNSKKRLAKASDEEEHVARLAERRERKRVKRAIVKTRSDIEENNSIELPANDKKKQKSFRVGSKKLPALALVHGFSATNVGRNRLTAPPPMLGVFNKGKASVKKQVGKKKMSTRDAAKSLLFSETAFLNKVSSNSKPASASSDIHDPSSEVETESSKRKITRAANEAKKEQEPPATDESHEASSDKGDTSSQHTDEECAVQSEVWNIEIDGCVLPSKSSSVSCQEGTVTLNTKNLFWMQGSAMITSCAQKSTPQEVGLCLDNVSDLSTSHSSLAPSQSASQVPACHSTSQIISSKYFKPQQRLTECATASAPPEHFEDSPFPIPSPCSPAPSLGINENTQHITYPDAADAFEHWSNGEQHNICSRQGMHPLGQGQGFQDEEALNISRRALESIDRHFVSDSSHPNTSAVAFQTILSPFPISKEDKIPFTSGDDPGYTSTFYRDDDVPEHPKCLSYTADWGEPLSLILPSLDTQVHEDNSWAPYIDPSIDASQAALVAVDADVYERDTTHRAWSWGYGDTQDMGFMEYEQPSYEGEHHKQSRVLDHPEGQGSDRNNFDGIVHPEELDYYEESDRLSQIPYQEDQVYHYDCQCRDSTGLLPYSNDADGVEESLTGEQLCEDMFLEGRELLLGFSGSGCSGLPWMGRMSLVEADVARHLKGHWLPQKL